MKTTRYITFEDRVFGVPDLMRLAHVLDPQISVEPGQKVWTEYEVTFRDGHNIEGLAVEVFAEEELIRPSPPFKIEMSLYSYSRAFIKVNLRCGDSNWKYENSIMISGDDANWVNANYTALEDALKKVAPQDLWWKRHRKLLLAILALGVEASIALIEEPILEIIDHIWPSRNPFIGLLHTSAHPLLLVISIQALCLGFGWVCALPIAFMIRRWLFSMWPSIEFNFGSPYLRPSMRRQKLNWTLTALIIPIFLGLLFFVLAMVPH